jgi:hypothetical protein
MCEAEWHKLVDGRLVPLDEPLTESPEWVAARQAHDERYGTPRLGDAEWPLVCIRHHSRESFEATLELCRRFGREVDPYTTEERDGFFCVTYDTSAGWAEMKAALPCQGR